MNTVALLERTKEVNWLGPSPYLMWSYGHIITWSNLQGWTVDLKMVQWRSTMGNLLSVHVHSYMVLVFWRNTGLRHFYIGYISTIDWFIR